MRRMSPVGRTSPLRKSSTSLESMSRMCSEADVGAECRSLTKNYGESPLKSRHRGDIFSGSSGRLKVTESGPFERLESRSRKKSASDPTTTLAGQERSPGGSV